jgi:hypothetical protein
VLWNTVAGKIITKNGRLNQNLLLYMAKQKPEPAAYDLLGEYRKALDNPHASLSGVPRFN